MGIEILENIYKQHYALLLKRALVIVGSKEKAEDVLHDVFLKLLNHPQKIENAKKILPFLLQSVTNQAINSWKVNNRLVFFDTEQQFNIKEEPTAPIEDSSLKRKLEQCLLNLPPKQQLIFKLSRYEGLDHEEISNYLNISKNTVKNQIVSTLKQLRNCFG